MLGCLDSTPIQRWDPSLLRLQGWNSSADQEGGGNKQSDAFIFFNFMPMLCWSILILWVPIFCLPDSFMTYKFSSVAQSCPTVCNPMNRSKPGLLVHHQNRSFPKLMSIKSVTPSSHLILCCPLLLLPPIPPSIRVFSNESALRMMWPKYWSFSFSIIPSKEHPGLISLRMTGWISLQSKGLTRVFPSTTVQQHQFFSAQLSSQSDSHIHT